MAFADDPELHVPALVPTHCAEAVLTTRWADGDPFRTLCDAPAVRRDAASRTLARFPWTCLLRHGFLHTDPHPGNFVFPGDGDVVVLD